MNLSLRYLLDCVFPASSQPTPPNPLKPSPIEETRWVQEMRDQKHNLLFFYGETKSFSQSPAYTIERHSLWRHNETNTPVAIRGSFSQEELPLGISREKVQGNLLLLKEDAIYDLDLELKEGVNFIRRTISVLVPVIDPEGNPTRLTAQMYVGTNGVRDQIIWDAMFHRSRGGRDFSLAKKMEDSRRWIGKFYKHEATNLNGDKHKCFLYLHRGLSDPVPTLKPADPPTVRIQVEQAIPTK